MIHIYVCESVISLKRVYLPYNHISSTLAEWTLLKNAEWNVSPQNRSPCPRDLFCCLQVWQHNFESCVNYFFCKYIWITVWGCSLSHRSHTASGTKSRDETWASVSALCYIQTHGMAPSRLGSVSYLSCLSIESSSPANPEVCLLDLVKLAMLTMWSSANHRCVLVTNLCPQHHHQWILKQVSASNVNRHWQK